MLHTSILTIETAIANRSDAMGSGDRFKSTTRRKRQLKITIAFFVLLCMGGNIFGQNKQQIYGGFGVGLDYGGIIGGKIEYLPIKNLGLFGGAGYNLLSFGWDVGATYKISPEKNVSPNLMIFYGCNGVSTIEGDGYSHYEMTSYGITIGGNLDFKSGNRGNTLSFGLFAPIRSQKFRDNYDAMKNDPGIELKKKLWPVAFSVGYNILINK